MVGSLGRKEATGKGVYFTFRYMMNDFMKDQYKWLKERNNIFAKTALANYDKPLRIAIQGFGNVGSVALEAHKCNHINNKLVAVSDRNITLYNSYGLDISGLVKFVNEHNKDLPISEAQLKDAEIKAELLHRDELLSLDVDVLFLAAMGRQVHKDNM